MKASIIIPTYNSCERLYFNLLSLNFQDYNMDDFEVVVVDNGSQDDTYKMVMEFNARYDLNYIRLNSNKGRSHARNEGANSSNGDILVFNDSDMINASGFISSHIKSHNEEKIITCGYGWRRIYSHYYREFRGYLRENFIKHKKKYNIKGREFCDKNSYLLLKDEEIEGDEFLKYSFFLENRQGIVDEIVKEFGKELKGYCFPWRFFMTNNCSMERKAFCTMGGFDENFKGWGFEDIELGYRLYKGSYKFRLAPECISVHQEHPIDISQNGNNNIDYLLDKHNNLDLHLFYFGKGCAADGKVLNDIAREAEKLEASGDYEELLRNFLEMLKKERSHEPISKFKRVLPHNNAMHFGSSIEKLKRETEVHSFINAYEKLNRITYGAGNKT